MVGTLSPSEEAQLAQTIEMFEVITQSQPQDYQSLEILKEAYAKLGRDEDVMRTAKRIAQVYVGLGQLSSAILEYESILQRNPDDPDVLASLGEIETKANRLATQPALGEVGGDTVVIKQTAPKAKPGLSRHQPQGDLDDGRKSMHKLFVESKVIHNAHFEECWVRGDFTSVPAKPADPFVQLLAERNYLPLEKALRLISDKARAGFLQIEKYEVDVELARHFSAEVCFRWCVLPFDRMSKSVLVATCNPFNRQAAADLEQVARGRILWYLATPAELARMLRKIFH